MVYEPNVDCPVDFDFNVTFQTRDGSAGTCYTYTIVINIIIVFMSLYFVTLIMGITCKVSLMHTGRQGHDVLAITHSEGKECVDSISTPDMHHRQKWHTLCFSVVGSACLFLLYVLHLGLNVFSVSLLNLLQKLQQTMEK